MMIGVSVTRNVAQVEQICRTEGRWVVTVHNHRIVKVQWVLEDFTDDGQVTQREIRARETMAKLHEGYTLPASELGGTFTEIDEGYREKAATVSVSRTKPQAEILDMMLSINTQWLVTVSAGQMVGAQMILQDDAPKTKPEPAPKPRTRRKKTASDAKASPVS